MSNALKIGMLSALRFIRGRSVRPWIAAWLVLVAGLAACSTVPPNAPLTDLPEEGTGPFGSITTGGYRYPALKPNGASDELLVFLAFSGGGKRSSAFSYGVLKGLRDMTIVVEGRERRLLDEIDFLSSVSGGSFTAAYYGLHREKIFTDFEDDFLRQDLEGEIIGLFLLPWKWEWLVNSVLGTNDMMAQIYDDAMFGGATYADLLANGLPIVVIGATDVTSGAVFPFTQEQFDLLCSDLSKLPLARAVAASNGFPVLFTPITLVNHAERCAGRRPGWLDAVRAGSDPSPRRTHLAAIAEKYLDAARTRYVHLMDGGISDNLGMRGLINALTAFDVNPVRIMGTKLAGARRIVVISADGQASPDDSWSRQPTVTGLGQILNAVSGTQIDLYNFETLQLARQELERLAAAISEARCRQEPIIAGHSCDDVTTHFIHLSLADIADDTVREQLQSIRTGLTLPDEDIDLLTEWGARLVQSSPELSRLQADLAAN